MGQIIQLKNGSDDVIPKCAFYVSLNTAGTETVSLVNGAYLIAITGLNTTQTARVGLYVGYSYSQGGSVLKEISSCSVCTLSLSGGVLTITTTANYISVRILPL